jgi:aminopeptidase N
MAEKSTAIRRADYQPPKYFTPEIHMTFFLDDEGIDGQARIVTKTKIQRNGQHNEPVVLNGEYFALDSVKVNGKALSASTDPKAGYVKGENTLTLDVGLESFELEVETSFNAKENGAAEGLYKQGGSYTTQCEAEGFRRITYAVDRPDNLAKFTTDIIFDPDKIQNALSNGNMTEEEVLNGTVKRQWANGETTQSESEHGKLVRRRWEDPFLKPTYLFALCGNNFAMIEDTYTTNAGRDVKLEVYAEPKYKEGLQHAMDSLKNAMRWDEDVWGLAYDLDKYMVVADDYFNMGAMENKGLNVFNPKYLLAHPSYANDADYYNVEGVIGHEYFHNWTGNRVTVKNWLELCLKEGLTVYRDQSFSADMGNALATRIQDVMALKASQFSEDNGPMVHAPRMEQAEEMNNIYTSTVYNKGAEVNRVLKSIVGEQGFKDGADLYFKRHDGQAVAVEDWVNAHADANNVNLDQFMLWYTQGGRPTLTADWSYDEKRGRFLLDLKQDVPVIEGVSDGAPRVIPVAFGLIDADGNEVVSETIHLNSVGEQYAYSVPKGCTPSLLRNFSAPVSLKADYNDDELLFLAKNDTDMFNRWSAIQMILERELVGGVKAEQNGKAYSVNPRITDLFETILDDATLDDEVKALMLNIPSIAMISQNFDKRDPVQISATRKVLEQEVSTTLYSKWIDTYQNTADYNKPYAYNMAEKGRRALMNKALHYIAASEEVAAYPLLKAHYSMSNNFNDKQAAFVAIMGSDMAKADHAHYRDDFYAQHKDYVTATDSWAQIVASSAPDTQGFGDLCDHADNKTNITANRIRSLFNGLAGNGGLFHAPDGSGYKLLADKIIQLESGAEDQRNPQLASRLVDNLSIFSQYKDDIRDKMHGELERIAQAPELSANTSEKLKKFLGADEYAALRTAATTQASSCKTSDPGPS